MMVLSSIEFSNRHIQDLKTIQEILSLPHSDIIVSSIRENDGTYKALSRFNENRWLLPDNLFVLNHPEHMKVLNFQEIPDEFQLIFKVICLKYYLSGREGSVKPRGSTLVSFLRNSLLFIRYISALNIHSLREINELMCRNYVHQCRQEVNKHTGKPISSNTLQRKFNAIEALFELSQNTFDPMKHPWPATSSTFLSGINTDINQKSSTEIIPEPVLSAIFCKAMEKINQADSLLTLRDEIDILRVHNSNHVDSVICEKLNQHLRKHHFNDGLNSFNRMLSQLLDSCIIVILITSGIRIHELASLKTDCMYTTYNNEQEPYYWMRGRSEKTHTGSTEWLVTEITHTAINVAIQLTNPLQTQLKQQIEEMPKENNLQAKKLRHHMNSLFLNQKNKNIRILSSAAIRDRLNKFAQYHDINWHFTPHQFRRTFAAYAAYSAYGDLRYLRKHFKHWTLDMTALYALNEQQDLELYDEIMVEIKNEKIAIVEHWLDQETPITGGMAEQIYVFRNKHEAVRTYQSRRELAEKISEQIHIRATSVAWCTADNGGCSGGKMIEKTRCNDCSHAVIDDRKTAIWQRIYQQQMELRQISDIGPAGQARIERDIQRCEQVLNKLSIPHFQLKEQINDKTV